MIHFEFARVAIPNLGCTTYDIYSRIEFFTHTVRIHEAERGANMKICVKFLYTNCFGVTCWSKLHSMHGNTCERVLNM